jgi:hypothetical protein
MSQYGAFSKKIKSFTNGISYKSGDIGEKLFDASNLILSQGKLVPRNGLRKFNSASFSESPQSLSFYLKYDGTTRSIIAKCGTVIKAASTDGVFSDIKTGLTSTTLHDAVTINGRHIIACGSDGLFSYDGTTFADLGVAAPTAPTAVKAAGGSLAVKTYVVAVTYYCQTTGFETNTGTDSVQVAVSGSDLTIAVTAIPVSTHPLVTHKRVYLKNVTDSGSYLLVSEITNATTTLNITANPSAAAESPTTGNDVPLSGGAKYLAIYNGCLVSAGNPTYPSDVFFSNPDEPDGWSTSNSLVHAKGNGPITGLATANVNLSDVSSYLVIFKRSSLTIYYQGINGPQYDSEVYIPGVGCVSHKTIRIKDGNIFFLSDHGWRVISQAKLLKNTLGKGDIDDIFKVNGWTYSVNKSNLSDAFSVYYSELDSYMTWVAEGANTNFNKCYSYGMTDDQFMPLLFNNCTCACSGQDNNGDEVVYIGRSDRNIYSYSIRNPGYDDTTSDGFVLDVNKLDEDVLRGDGTSSIPWNVTFNWQPNEDLDATFNFRNFFLEAISDATSSSVDVVANINFSRSASYLYSVNLYAIEGFILDVSRLDIDVLADDRIRNRQSCDINLVSRNLLLTISQNVKGARLQLLASQLNYSKNGNSNL